jgi:photosystem II stability/assembly factor-like uncharacterized protein
MKTSKFLLLVCLLATLILGAGPYVSADSSGTWISQPCGSQTILRGVSFVDSQRGWVVGNDGTILTTSNGGEDWTTQSIGIDVDFYGVSFPDSLHGWACGYRPGGFGGYIYVTSDGGLTWIEQLHISNVIFSDILFVDSSHGWAVGTGGIWATSDGGTTWNKQYGGSSISLGGVSFVDSTHGWAVGFNNAIPSSLILTTSNGGVTWTEQGEPITFEGFPAGLGDVFFIDSTHGCIVGGYGTILTTSDGGLTWIQRITDAYVGSEDGTITRVSFADLSHGWAVGNWMILETTDGGTSWSLQRLYQDDIALRDVFFVDSSHGWAVGWKHAGTGTILKYTPTVSGVDIDVKPGTEPNSVNLKSKGLLPVAILGSSSFDVITVNPATINIGVVQLASRGSAKTPKLAYSLSDVNSDGYLDLVANFEIQALVNAGVLTPTTVTLTLKANLYDTTPIEGTDSANIVPR